MEITRKPVQGLLGIGDYDFLDIPPSTTPLEFLEIIQSLERECVGFHTGEKWLCAPVCGGRTSVDLGSLYDDLGDAIQGVHHFHNHPGNGVVSKVDLSFAWLTAAISTTIVAN